MNGHIFIILTYSRMLSSMKKHNILSGLFPIVMSALGGAMMVFSAYDDSPGGQLLGVLFIAFGAFLSVKAT